MADSNSCQLDVDLASEVQQLLFPKSSPVCSWCCIGVRNRMARGLGGDYFDFITMPDECQVVFLGDVTGHGLHASVVMSLLYGFIHHSARRECTPLELVTEVNNFLRSFAERSQELDHFFSSTLFFGIIDPRSRVMHYVNAGHPGPLVRRAGKLHSLGATAPPVGFFDAPEVAMESFTFATGDRFLLFTDGIPETLNAADELFGMDRIKRLLLGHGGDHLEFLDALFNAWRQFGAQESPEDDCTAIVMDLEGHFPFS